MVSGNGLLSCPLSLHWFPVSSWSSEDRVLGHWRSAEWMTSTWGIALGDVLEKELVGSGGSLSSAADPQV